MLKAYSKYFPFASHPILSKIKKFIEDNDVESLYIDFLKYNTVFLYPKIISFSFIPYPPSFRDFSFKSSYGKDEKYFSEEYIKKMLSLVPTEENYYTFLSLLHQFFRNENINSIFVLDIRNSNVISTDLISWILKSSQDEFAKIYILAYRDIHPELLEIVENRKCCLVSSSRSLFLDIDEFVQQDKNVHHINLPAELTIEALGRSLIQSDLEEISKKKFLIRLNFLNSHSINIFAACLMCLYIRSVSPYLGLRWSYRINRKSKFYERLRKLRVFEINEFFFNNSITERSDSDDLDYRSLGIYIFDKNVKRVLYRTIDDFLKRIHSYFEIYLNQNVSYLFEFKHTSRKPQKRSMPRIHFIDEIIHELIDNIFLHSSSVGYLALEISKYHLFIFIGDCGMGLKEGILRNYKLSEQIKDDKDAIKMLFELYDWNPKRRTTQDFNIGAGTGLKQTLYNISLLNGKFIYRTGKVIGAFMNPVLSRGTKPSKIIDSYTEIAGTQYCIMIPLTESSIETLPSTTTDFFNHLD
jgi:hypothetical protein